MTHLALPTLSGCCGEVSQADVLHARGLLAQSDLMLGGHVEGLARIDSQQGRAPAGPWRSSAGAWPPRQSALRAACAAYPSRATWTPRSCL